MANHFERTNAALDLTVILDNYTNNTLNKSSYKFRFSFILMVNCVSNSLV